jgi:hypothetical protein
LLTICAGIIDDIVIMGHVNLLKAEKEFNIGQERIFYYGWSR